MRVRHVEFSNYTVSSVVIGGFVKCMINRRDEEECGGSTGTLVGNLGQPCGSSIFVKMTGMIFRLWLDFACTCRLAGWLEKREGAEERKGGS